MNYFDVEKEFFLIDSDNLQDAETKLYGYSFQESGIYENDNLTEAAVSGLNGGGVYIYVEVKDGKITIQQDINGSYGIYLFRQGSYFALSNSFLRLLEYVKARFPVSLNRDYANCHLAEWYANRVAYSDTLVQEIHTLERDVVVEIDIAGKELAFQKVDYKESSLWINSAEGMEALDRWFVRWTNIFRRLKQKTDQIIMDLSGGFDTRIMFLLMLQSGIDLNEIYVHSIKDDLYTHKEDYKIASEMAEYYGFELNNSKVIKQGYLPYSMEDILNISSYLKMGFHKEMHFKNTKHEWPRYRVVGFGGESVRAYYSMTAQEYKDLVCSRANQYSLSLQADMKASICRLLDDAYQKVKKKNHISDDNSTNYPLYLFRETDNRVHFGKGSLENYFSNTFDLTPYIDPDLLKLRLNDPGCQDNNLLMAVMYVRYCPKLLDYRFARGGMDPSTVEFARKINDKFDKAQSAVLRNRSGEDSAFLVKARDEKVAQLKSATDNQRIPAGEPERYLKSVFDSTKCRKLFATCFDEEIYCKADMFYGEQGYHPMRHCYSVLAVTKVIEDAIARKGERPLTPIESMDRYIHENYYQPDNSLELVMRLRDYLTARMDFQLSGVENPELEVVTVSDDRAMVSMPEWIQQEGIGYMVETYMGSIDISLCSATGGRLTIWERGRNISDGEGGRIAYWIEYQNVQYNGEAVSEAQGLVWHDKPICLEYSLKAGETIHFHAEWKPYRGDHRHVEETGKQLNRIKKLQNEIKDNKATIKEKDREIREIKNSHSFRFGNKVMYAPGKVKEKLKNFGKGK